MVLLARDRRHGVGHRAQMDWNVLGLHDQLAAWVEQGGGAIASLGDVGGVGRADQDCSHLVAGGPQRAGHQLKCNGIEVHDRSAVIVPPSSTDALHPGGRTRVASGSSKTQGPSAVERGAGSPRRTCVVSHSPPKRAWRSLRSSSPPPAARGSGSGPGSYAETRIVTSSRRPSGSLYP